MERIWAVRGATTIVEDTAIEVVAATKELLEEIFKLNNIEPEALVSIIFTVTPDIRSEFPAVAARQLGLADTPLICMLEIPKPGALPKCIRVLLHFYTSLTKDRLRPVYLKEAKKLRPDLTPE